MTPSDGRREPTTPRWIDGYFQEQRFMVMRRTHWNFLARRGRAKQSIVLFYAQEGVRNGGEEAEEVHARGKGRGADMVPRGLHIPCLPK